MKKMLKNIKNEEFEYEVVDVTEESVSVLEPGYVITPDGEFIPIYNGEDHNVVFSDYFNKYLDNKIPVLHESTEAMVDLVKINHIVYYGLREAELATIYNDGNVDQEGVGYLLLPIHFQEVLTEEQKEAIKVLLATNKSLFGDYEKMHIRVRETINGSDLDKEDFKLFLENKEEIERKN